MERRLIQRLHIRRIDWTLLELCLELALVYFISIKRREKLGVDMQVFYLIDCDVYIVIGDALISAMSL